MPFFNFCLSLFKLTFKKGGRVALFETLKFNLLISDRSFRAYAVVEW